MKPRPGTKRALVGLVCGWWLVSGAACSPESPSACETVAADVTGQPEGGDESMPGGTRSDLCGDRVCGLAPLRGHGQLVSCGWCPAGELCRGGQCVVAPCLQPQDCASESPLAGGLFHTCVRPADWGEGTCQYAFDDQGEVLSSFQRIYQGAALHLGRARLTAGGEPSTCDVPASQDITPIEATCCAAQGGPDRNGDDRCDADPMVWSTSTWADLGFVLAADHQLVYRFGRDEVPPGASASAPFVIEAQVDLECNTLQTSFSVAAVASDKACRLETPATIHVSIPAGDARGSTPVAFDVTLLPSQRAGFLASPWHGFGSQASPSLESLNPHFDEAKLSLQRLAEGLAAAWQSGAPGACAFPPTLPVSPIERTCCSALGANDADQDGLCAPRATDWQGGWADLGFALTTEHAFVYTTAAVSPTRARAIAYGDLDCDSIQSTFVRFVQGTDTGTACEAQILDGWFIEYENE